MKFKQFEKYTPVTKENAEYVRALAEYCKSSDRRPSFHLTPPCGLMNDPNGLNYYNGAYHVFYQWFPFGTSHGMKHWGHFVSRDLVNWESSSEILIPTEEYEKNGCYSGNGIQIGNELFLYYTANYNTPEGKAPKQALAIMSSDGTINKYEKNPIIDEKPEGLDRAIRDPYVFERNGSFYMLLGGGTTTGHGRLLLYKSSDGYDWNFRGCVNIAGLEFGYMIECPGIVSVDGKDVLFLSAMGLEPDGDRYNNEFSTIYLIGHLDVDNPEFYVEAYDELDKGFDFYAPQAFYDENGMPIFLGWFGCGCQTLPHMEEDMWVHGLTMPRRMSIVNGKLIQSLHEKAVARYDTVELTDGQIIPLKNSFRLHVPECKDEITVIQIGEDGDCFKIIVDREHGRLTVDRSCLKEKFCLKYGEERSLSFKPGDEIYLDLYYDNTFAELFINGGKEVMSFRAFPESLNIKMR